jgi:hypothetical protein
MGGIRGRTTAYLMEPSSEAQRQERTEELSASVAVVDTNGAGA